LIRSDRQRGGAGYAVAEIVAVMAVMAVASVVYARLFMETTSLWRDVETRTNRLGPLDRVVEQLHADVWGATDLHVDDHRVLIIDRLNHRIRWRLDPNSGDVARMRVGEVRGGQRQTWRIPERARFEPAGCGAALHIPRTVSAAPETHRLTGVLEREPAP
jgi:hypothetical protein